MLICHCILLTVLLPSYVPYSRWPPWADAWSKPSCGDEGGLKELLTKPPWLSFKPNFLQCSNLSAEGRSRFVTQELAVLSGLLLVLVEIKWISWQPVKKPSVKVLELMLERNTLKEWMNRFPCAGYYFNYSNHLCATSSLAFIYHFSYSKTGIIKSSSCICICWCWIFLSLFPLHRINKHRYLHKYLCTVPPAQS